MRAKESRVNLEDSRACRLKGRVKVFQTKKEETFYSRPKEGGGSDLTNGHGSLTKRGTGRARGENQGGKGKKKKKKKVRSRRHPSPAVVRGSLKINPAYSLGRR